METTPKRKRTLYLYKTTFQQLWYMWDVKPNPKWEGEELFIQCNASGIVNWEKASVYLVDEIKDRLHKIFNP